MDHHTITPLATVTITLAVILTALPLSSSAPASSLPPYANHTVGGPTGWLFDSKKNSSAADYSKWARSQAFHLGDYLIFKTNTNMSVIQTYNETTYRRCDPSEDGGDDIAIYASGRFGDAEVIAVPLTAEGVNYFFSGAEGGIQCVKGMRFEISVQKGRGLPPSLSQPPPPPYVEPVAPPPPETASGTVAGGSPQGEEFYTGGGDGGAPTWGFFWEFGFLNVVFLLFY